MSHDNQLATLLQASLVADSLALPVNWIYDPEAIAGGVGRLTDIIAPPASSYHAGQPAGGQTHHGEQALVLMDSLADRHAFAGDVFIARWQAWWGHAKSYRDGATKATLANLAAGASPLDAGSESADLGGASRLAPLIVAMAQATEAELVMAARAQTAITHRAPAAIDAAAFIVRAVRAVLAGAAVPEALAAAAEARYAGLSIDKHLKAALATVGQDVTASVQALGPGCPVGGALPGAMAVALAYPNDLEGALIANAMAAGDSAARGLFLGMLLGAVPGAAVPERWLLRWLARQQVADFLAAQGVSSVPTGH